ncbi:ABC transporter ATP-binding protein [Gephyromycinifex aptenodytis]|uniref:ABC transporter ATP-binding protein n=1 Tax=Gephyromycinifex aptenodytis TaxID=2716227 RepID=UPI00144704DE|nr:ABC transporter ATP-binding protein [Gephyromycinifex aptenodytis]
MSALLEARGLVVGYPGRPAVLHGVNVSIPDGAFTAVVGPNGCGKSTLLLSLARLLRPQAGEVFVRGRNSRSFSPRELARTLAVLPQQPSAPDGIIVRDLVLRGRQPHRRPFAPPTASDRAAVDAALAVTATTGLADRPVARLSGGQRQRVWIAMILAQDTGALLLDEPISFLDIAHQVDVLDVCAALVDRGGAVVAVLHDLGLAARYADHVVVVHAGRVVASGTPADVVTAEIVGEVFGLAARVVPDPETGTPLVVPRRRPIPKIA